MASPLDTFAAWAIGANDSEVVRSMLKSINSSKKHATENERCRHVEGAAEALGIDDFPFLHLPVCDTAPHTKRRKLATAAESDTDSDEQSDNEGVESSAPAKFVPKQIYRILTGTTSGGTETSYFRADTEDDVTWLYKISQVQECVDAEDIPATAKPGDLFLSDHRETNFAPKTKFVVDEEAKQRIVGVCNLGSAFTPACLFVFNAGKESLPQRADDYINILLARGSFPASRLRKMLGHLQRFTYQNIDESGKCSACGLRRHLKFKLQCGTDVLKLGCFCYERVHLAWELCRELARAPAEQTDSAFHKLFDKFQTLC